MTTPVFNQIRQIVKKIPRGNVSTYGRVAAAAHVFNPRVVGWALHGNQDQSIPCHRVVRKNGELATGFVGGWQEQHRRLLKDGVIFISPNQVDMSKCFFDLAKVIH